MSQLGYGKKRRRHTRTDIHDRIKRLSSLRRTKMSGRTKDDLKWVRRDNVIHLSAYSGLIALVFSVRMRSTKELRSHAPSPTVTTLNSNMGANKNTSSDDLQIQMVSLLSPKIVSLSPKTIFLILRTSPKGEVWGGNLFNTHEDGARVY